MNKKCNVLRFWSLVAAFTAIALLPQARAQDEYDDPPTRVARLGYLEGSVSFQPAGETDWVGAVPNRPMTTGDKLWSDRDSRAELQLGSAVIRLSENTGVSFLNLDDHTVQLQLSSGSVNIRIRRLSDNDDFEVDTPNLAFTAFEPGNYRLSASEDGSYTVVNIRAGDGEATGNGQSYSVHAGQFATFRGTDSLNIDVEPIGGPDQFDTWADGREYRWEHSRSSEYLSHDVVGYDDLDDSGDWRDNPDYGHVWYPHVEAGWAPYREGHWAWIDPWGYTWVDDEPWGYAPFHYGRWVFVGGAWGWIAGPPAVEPVYAPALVVFVGGGGGWGGNIGWFPLGPREVWVPSYPVSRTYMTQVNVSNTVVNQTVITNVYNTTIVNKTTTITSVTYVNRGVQGAVTAVPQNAMASAQPVSKVAVRVTPQQVASAPMIPHAPVVPTAQAVLGAKAATAGHVAAPPAAVASRQVIAKKAPPPPPPPFAARQQALAAHPGQPLPKQQLASLRPASAPRPAVRVAPPSKPVTPPAGRPANAGQPAPAAQPANRPENNRPAEAPARPAPQPNNRPETNRPPAESNRPAVESSRPPENRPPAAQPSNRPAENRPPAAEQSRPAPNRNEPSPRQAAPQEHPQQQAAPPPKPEKKQPPPEKKPEDEKRPPGL
jgi:hypothetical protein